jgi:putative YphP/YqiW family bacilliredoxin
MFEKIQLRMPMYDEEAVQPMRDELLAYGFQEARTPQDLDKILGESKGTVFVVTNSVCGCAAGSARPGVGLALQHNIIPDRLVTVFAGQDRDSVDRLRQNYLSDFQPSSPSMALFKDGKVVFMMHRHMIEGRHPGQIAQLLTEEFEKHCSKQGPSISPEAFEQVITAVECGSKIPRNF